MGRARTGLLDAVGNFIDVLRDRLLYKQGVLSGHFTQVAVRGCQHVQQRPQVEPPRVLGEAMSERSYNVIMSCAPLMLNVESNA